MPELIEDFWPDDIGKSTLRTPGTILKEVASQLGPKTQQLVKAEVSTSSNGTSIVQSFNLVVPAMDNYKYQLFVLQHAITLYPLTIGWKNTGFGIADEEALIAKVKEIIGSQDTKKIVQALIAQVSSSGTI